VTSVMPDWPSNLPSLLGHGLQLRPWLNADVESLHLASQNEDIQRWTTVPSPYTLSHAQDFVASRPMALAQRQVAPFAIAHGESDSLLGSCSLMRPDFANRVVEVGYWVAPWARGVGVAVKALTVLCDWAGEIGFERVEAVVLAGNDASAVVAERAGLGFEALLKSRVLLDGKRHDVRLHARVLTEAGGLGACEAAPSTA